MVLHLGPLTGPRSKVICCCLAIKKERRSEEMKPKDPVREEFERQRKEALKESIELEEADFDWTEE